MKKLILILPLLLFACIEQEIKLPEGANAKTAFGCPNTYIFNIGNSTMTQVIQNHKYNFSIQTNAIAWTSGIPLGTTQPITSINATVTYRVWNTGQSTLRYKVTSTGSWITVGVGLTSDFTRPTVIRGNPFDCQNPITVYTFTVYTERMNCGTMQGNSNHFAPVIQIHSVSNGHNDDGSQIGINTSSLVCPL